MCGAKNRPVDPPLSYVSRLIREEVLPIFFSRVLIQLDCKIEVGKGSDPQFIRDLWYRELPWEKLRHIQRFALPYYLSSYTPHWPLYEWEFRLNKGTSSYTLGHGFYRQKKVRAANEKRYKYMEYKIVQIIDDHLLKSLDEWSLVLELEILELWIWRGW